jgi:hypothetical protein
VFSNTSSLLGALNQGGMDGFRRYGTNTINMLTNIVHPAAISQIERAALPYYTKTNADTFLGELKNQELNKSYVLRKIAKQYPPSKINIWGDVMMKRGNIAERLFGINHINRDNFAQPIYEDTKRTGDNGFLPPAIYPELNNKKLNVEQTRRLEQLVGQSRKQYVSPYVNGFAEIEGFDVKYSQLTDADRKYVLSYLYSLGKKDGEAKFALEYPEFAKQEADVDYEKEIQKDIFKLLNKYKSE